MPTTGVKLSRQQTGRIGEAMATAMFLRWGFRVYSPEADDHGVDLVVRHPQSESYYEIQVKTVTGRKYAFIPKSRVPELSGDRIVCYIRLGLEGESDIYLIPMRAWRHPNAVLVDRAYDKPGQTSKPEYGICSSKKSDPLLEPYRADLVLSKIVEQASHKP
ncbi:MAG: DUF4365 domain-containing protein [Adlercreutzia sp.]|nr:DUF4365 domain-containing protein [Adlercreutzia sp.]